MSTILLYTIKSRENKRVGDVQESRNYNGMQFMSHNIKILEKIIDNSHPLEVGHLLQEISLFNLGG